MALKAIITTHGVPKGAAPSEDACGAELWNDAIIAVVADGVGQAEFAAEAAQRIVESTLQNFKARPRTWSLQKALDEFVRLSNRTLHHESLARFERPELVSTVAVVAIEGPRLVGLNVGDSRVYCLRGDQFRQLSQDQSKPSVKWGHVLTQAVGLQPDVSPHVFQCEVRSGDVILLCSDGVTKQLADAEISELLQHGATARVVVQTAAERATTVRRMDDTTAIVIRLQDASHPATT